jgi:glycosyltransferase involved in cell wall biosynthesis
MQPLDGPERTGFLYVGRLVADKKPMQMLNAFVMALPQLPADSKLLIVGDGPERANLERRILELNLSDRVKMFGHVGDYARLKEIYRQALASISAGAVGLSITQSLGFGVPMLYSRHDPHGPEIVAAREGWNCLCFETDSVEDLAAHMLQLQNERAAWISRAPAISSECRASFSVEKMAGEFIKAVLGPDK